MQPLSLPCLKDGNHTILTNETVYLPLPEEEKYFDLPHISEDLVDASFLAMLASAKALRDAPIEVLQQHKKVTTLEYVTTQYFVTCAAIFCLWNSSRG